MVRTYFDTIEYNESEIILYLDGEVVSRIDDFDLGVDLKGEIDRIELDKIVINYLEEYNYKFVSYFGTEDSDKLKIKIIDKGKERYIEG